MNNLIIITIVLIIVTMYQFRDSIMYVTQILIVTYNYNSNMVNIINNKYFNKN
jgi:hypothetical protein